MINTTPARAEFKRHLGQANHFLVTALVALHQLQRSDVTDAPEELRTSWNPKDKAASIARTRIFVAQSFLGWAVDSIDLYLSLLNRKPKFLRDQALIGALDGAGRSVLRKAQIIAQHYSICPATCALVDVLITWRNNVFHELADNALAADSLAQSKSTRRSLKSIIAGSAPVNCSERLRAVTPSHSKKPPLLFVHHTPLFRPLIRRFSRPSISRPSASRLFWTR